MLELENNNYLLKGSLIGIAAIPNMGLSSFLINIVNNIIINNEEEILFITFDKTKTYFKERLLNKNIEVIDDYKVDDFNNIKAKLLLNDNLKYVIIDHLEYITNNNINIIKELKQIAVNKNIVIISSSHLHRDIEKRNDQTPTLSDFMKNRGSHNYFDKVLLISKDTNSNSSIEKRKIIIAKKNFGETKTIILNFNKETEKFYE